MNFVTKPLGSYLFKRYRARLAIGLTLSLIVHAFVVSLQFGIPGLGLPGLELPWNERRAQTPELSIRIANVERLPSAAPNAAPLPEPQEPARSEPPAQLVRPSGARVTLPSQASKPTAPAMREIPPPQPHPTPPKAHTPVISKLEASPDSFVLPSASPEEPEPEVMTRTETPDLPPKVVEDTVPEAAPAKPPEQPVVQDKEPAPQERKKEAAVVSEQEMDAKKQADAVASRLAAETQARKQAEEADRLQAAAVALQKQAKLEAEAAKRAQQLAAKKQDEARKQEQAETERKAAKLEARKQAEENARQQAALDRQKKAEQLAAREKAQELANRQKADALAAQQRERNAAVSLTAGTPSSAGTNRATETASLPGNLLGGVASRAIEQARKFDLQRNEPPVRPADKAENSRRRSVFGSIDQDFGVTMYIESWRQKVERNGNMNYRPSAPDRAREDPVVTVSIRSDGSVEDIAIVRSSGLPELDDAVRRIVRLYARYSAFPPDLARRYDVIEIRRVWNFDDKLRIREEMR